MKDATISELYDLTQTIAAKIFEGKTYPWEVLPLIKDFIPELGETLDPAEYEKRGENARFVTLSSAGSAHAIWDKHQRTFMHRNE